MAENMLRLAFRARKGGADRENPPSCVSSKERVVVMEKTLRLAFRARKGGGYRENPLSRVLSEGGWWWQPKIPSVLRFERFRARESGSGGRKNAKKREKLTKGGIENIGRHEV